MRDVDINDILQSVDFVRIDGGGNDAITIPDAKQLFTAEFSRDGTDLILQADGFADIRIEDYFAGGTPSDLVSPDGAVLRGHIVERLVGPLAPGQYAQSGEEATDGPIGQVEIIEGGAFAMRSDGTRVALELGSKVYQNDVISTDDGGKVSITFADGTIFSLAENSRMVLDELVYASDGGNNSATFNLIEGSFVFIAGEVAKSGDMEVNTPSATMGIRGTTVKVEFVSESGDTEISLHFDPDGGKGLIEVYDRSGNFLGTIQSTQEKWIVRPEDDQPQIVNRTIDDDASDAEILEDAGRAYALAYGRVADGQNFVEQPSSSRRSGDGNGIKNTQPDNEGNDGENEGLPSEDGIDDDNSGDGVGVEKETRFIQETPLLQNDIANVQEDGTVTIAVLANDSDTENDGLTVTGASNGTFGTTTVNPDGTITYTPDDDANGTDSFTYTVSDGNGGTDTATVSLTVNPVRDIADDTDVTTANTPVTTSVLANDSFEATPLLAVLSGDEPGNGSVVVNSDNTITYTPDADFTGIDVYSYTVVSGGVTETATVTVAVTGVEDGNSGVNDGDLVAGTDANDDLKGGPQDDIIFGLDGNDTLTGNPGDDTLIGGLGNDELNGGVGNDFLRGGLGIDTLNGANGNDTLVYEGELNTYNGGNGRDILLVVAGSTPGTDLLPVLNGTSIEAIDLNNGSVETLNVTYQDVMNMSSEADTVLEALLGAALPDSATIYGDAGDQVNLAGDTNGEWQTGNTVVDNDGNDLTVYQFVSSATNDVLATLAIDDDVQVSLPTA